MKKKISWQVFVALVVVMGLGLLAACQTTEPAPAQGEPQAEEVAPAEPEVPAIPEAVEPPPEPVATDPPPPTDTPEPTPTLLPLTPTTEPTLEPLPPEPVDVEFQAEDMVVLKGRYYPAAVNPAPMIVLMHWAPGDKEEWNEMAFWFQNRGLAGTSPKAGQQTWLDPTWFPPMLAGQSFAVFTFTFRGCDNGCSSFNPNGWFLDAIAAMETAAALEGVDPALITTIGASIGADGSPDACGPFNNIHNNGCLSALSLSPGSYLRVPYDGAVAALEAQDPPKPVWCFYSKGDGESALACKSATGELYQPFEWDGSRHGMMLIDPAVDPSAMELILEFLKLTYGL